MAISQPPGHGTILLKAAGSSREPHGMAGEEFSKAVPVQQSHSPYPSNPVILNREVACKKGRTPPMCVSNAGYVTHDLKYLLPRPS